MRRSDTERHGRTRNDDRPAGAINLLERTTGRKAREGGSIMRWLFRKGRRLSLLALAGAFFFDSRRGARRRAAAKDWAGRATTAARRRAHQARGSAAGTR
jgi:hypothetical protein